MRFFAIIVVLSPVFASVSAAIYPRQFANCALSCLASGPMGNCASDDNVCLCKNTAFVDATTKCIEQSCSGTDITQSEQYAQQLCEAVGVTTSPTSTGSGGLSGTPTTSSPGSSTSTTNGAMFDGANGLLGLAAAVLVSVVL